ncbi:hypothetical protein HOC35_02985 [Candidatus Woesearchaeota archaeon]|jgi:hypothetical protein|nr:hypothetical protein [Candidatus Woesearchaeota archaeon]
MSWDTVIYYLAYPREIAGIDVILPFFLLFVILYAALNTTQVFKKNQAIAVSFILSLLVIVPHLTGTYPPCYDLVIIINNVMPQFGLMIMAAFTFMIILVFVGLRSQLSKLWMGIAAVFSIAFIAYSFVAAKSGYYMQMCPSPPQFFDVIGALTEAGWLAAVIIIIVVFFLIRGLRNRANV